MIIFKSNCPRFQGENLDSNQLSNQCGTALLQSIIRLVDLEIGSVNNHQYYKALESETITGKIFFIKNVLLIIY